MLPRKIQLTMTLIVLTLCYLRAGPAVALAQSPDDKEAQLLIPPSFPTEVTVDLGIGDITSINERDQVFEVDAQLAAWWVDERLAFDAEAFGDDQKIYQGEAATEKLKTEIWWPDFEITDARGPRDRMFVELAVFDDGSVFYRERFRVFIGQPFFLGAFPFDEHFISLNIEPFSQAGDRVVFLEPEESTLEFGWDTNEWSIGEFERIIDSGDASEAAAEAVSFASATFGMTISRNPSFYISNIVLPLLLIVAISWAVFWMNFGEMHLADRLSVSFTSVLTVVAFDFVTSDTLPKLPYPTLLDRLLTVSYIFLALTVLENVIAHTLHEKGNEAGAARVDKLSRWLFPVSYYLVLLLAMLWGILVNVE